MVNQSFYRGMLVAFLIALAGVYVYQNILYPPKSSTEEESVILLKSIENISKLMLVEANFNEVYTYKDKSNVFFGIIPAEKKAIVVMNAKVQIGYDLKKIKFEINKERKELIIQSVPAEEIIISPDVKFFDIQTSTFTNFEAADINKVNTQAKKKIEQQIETSGIKKNAKLQLVQSLNGIVGITNTLGWRVIDNTNTIQLSK
jgi:hypothetical protein